MTIPEAPPLPANTRQVGGRHYRDLPIQPWDYIAAADLNPFEAAVVKYVTRWKSKGGVEDLRKARHYLDKLLELHTRFNYPMDPIMPEQLGALLGITGDARPAGPPIRRSAPDGDALWQLPHIQRAALELCERIAILRSATVGRGPVTDAQLQLQNSLHEALALTRQSLHALQAAVETTKEAYDE